MTEVKAFASKGHGVSILTQPFVETSQPCEMAPDGSG